MLVRAKTKDRFRHSADIEACIFALCYGEIPDCKYLRTLMQTFSSDPEKYFSKIHRHRCLTHHRNSRDFLKYYGSTGVFNTGFVGVKIM